MFFRAYRIKDLTETLFIVDEVNKELKLKEAINLYSKEESTPSNSYEWYRKSAQQEGRVLIGNFNVPVYKKKGSWYVNKKEFDKAILQHNEKIKLKKQVTLDHANGIIHGKDGDIIDMEWGGYQIRRDFRFEWSDYERYRNKSDGTWYCNKCNIPAETEHDKEECHLCRDWNGCGKDCTLSKVYCFECRAFYEF